MKELQGVLYLLELNFHGICDVKNAGALNYFTLFVPMDVDDHIACETNSYAEYVQREKGEMDDRWTASSRPEISAFIELLWELRHAIPTRITGRIMTFLVRQDLRTP